MGDMSVNFSRAEFACKCGCGFDAIDPDLVFNLQRLRDRVGRPLIVNSGCRCEKRNADQKGAAQSSHLTGMAADILVKSSKERFELLEANFRGGIPVFEILEFGTKWIHFSNDRLKAQRIAILLAEA